MGRGRPKKSAEERQTELSEKLKLTNGMKWCPSCGFMLDVREFGSAPARPDGLNGYCNTCRGRISKERYHSKLKHQPKEKKEPKRVLKNRLDGLIRAALLETPHLSSSIIAKRLFTSAMTVEDIRTGMEERKEMPFYMEVKTAKGQWRKRKFKTKCDPYEAKHTVYFIQDSSGPVKIGYSFKGVYGRIGSMENGNPRILRLIAAMPGTRLTEKRLHRLFQKHKIKTRREWFECSPELLALIEKIRKKHPIQPLRSITEARVEAMARYEAMKLATRLGSNPFAVDGKKQCGQCEKSCP